MNTFLKANKNLKSQKATVILLSLFLIFFVSSINGRFNRSGMASRIYTKLRSY